MKLKRCISELCIFFRDALILGLYVDDILCIGRKRHLKELISDFKNEVDFRDLGSVKNILSLGVQKKEDGLLVSQEAYATNILEEYDVKGKTATSPLPINVDTEENDTQPVSITEYKAIVGSLLYLSNNTRPDTSYAVCALSQKCCSPTELDMKNAHQALRYLKNTKKIGIHLRKTGEPLKAYVDSSWVK